MDDPSNQRLSNNTTDSGKTFVQSPSGNLLDSKAYAKHPDRPLTLKERQERIGLAMRSESQGGRYRMSDVTLDEGDLGYVRSGGGWGCCGACFGRGTKRW